MRALNEAGLLEISIVDGMPSWTIEIFEGSKRPSPLE
jgi:hypothetical protein